MPWFRNECEREGARDFERNGRPSYERSRYDHDDKCYFTGYDEAEREADRRRDEEREQEAAEQRAAANRAQAARDAQWQEEAADEQQRQEFYAMQDEWAADAAERESKT